MRRSTAALLLSLSVFIATPSYAANNDRDFGRGFGARVRAAIHRIAQHIASNVDWLTPPKP
jgi:hypothetical protein